MGLSDTEIVLHEEVLNRLGSDLIAAHDASQLPDEPTTTRALNEFVVRLRLQEPRRTSPP